MIEQIHNNQATLRLQHAINDFKHKQYDKFTLQKKLSILKQKCQTNQKKAKVARNQISKINTIKNNYQTQRSQIQQLLADSAERSAIKIKRDKTLRERSKQNMHVIRNLIQKEKHQQYHKIKEKTRVNQMRISQHFRQTLHIKRQKSLEVKIQEQNSRLNRTIFMEKKRLLAQSKSQQQLKPIEAGTQRNNAYIKHMKELQKQMVEQLKNSRASLRNSKMSYKKTVR